MACSACSANVENKLRSIAGINEASVNLVGRTATIDFDPAQVSLEEIKKQISDIGYDLVIDEERTMIVIYTQENTMWHTPEQHAFTYCFPLCSLIIRTPSQSAPPIIPPNVLWSKSAS